MNDEPEFIAPGTVRWIEDNAGEVYVNVDDLSIALQMSIIENADACAAICHPDDTFTPDELKAVILRFGDAIGETLEALRLG